MLPWVGLTKELIEMMSVEEFNPGRGSNDFPVLKIATSTEEMNGIGCCEVRRCKSFHSHRGSYGEHWRESA